VFVEVAEEEVSVLETVALGVTKSLKLSAPVTETVALANKEESVLDATSEANALAEAEVNEAVTLAVVEGTAREREG
jgi:hypothetical protein